MPKVVVIRGKTLVYNARVQKEYAVKLKKLVEKMTQETREEIVALFESRTGESFKRVQTQATALDASIASQAKILTDKLSRRFDLLFGRKAEILARGVLKGTNAMSRAAIKNNTTQLASQLTLGTTVLRKELKEVVKASINENVSLIKSIQQEYLSKVKGQVMRSITSGNGLKDLIPQLDKYDSITFRRAKNIALDQTRKAYNSINAARMKMRGWKQFEWLHSGGTQHPRPHHVAMSGKIFSFDASIPADEGGLPIIDEKTGERGIPGQAPFCHCTMVPLITYDEEIE